MPSNRARGHPFMGGRLPAARTFSRSLRVSIFFSILQYANTPTPMEPYPDDQCWPSSSSSLAHGWCPWWQAKPTTITTTTYICDPEVRRASKQAHKKINIEHIHCCGGRTIYHSDWLTASIELKSSHFPTSSSAEQHRHIWQTNEHTSSECGNGTRGCNPSRKVDDTFRKVFYACVQIPFLFERVYGNT